MDIPIIGAIHADLPEQTIDVVQDLINSAMTSVYTETAYSTVHSTELVRVGWRSTDNPIRDTDLDEGVLGRHVDCVGTAILLNARIQAVISSEYSDGTCLWVFFLNV